jgi:glyoxylase-like metal-dependent hydrolase (beta-lactamase superfamily II)/rhodanese-related sulfurtransferase
VFFTQYYLDCLSHASYMIADETSKKAVVVDPRRDVSEYIADAEAHGFTIEGVINTHFHADFLAGHLEMAAQAGAWIGYGQRAEAEYAIRKFAHNERVSLGDVTLEILETPGHTPESISVLVYEHADDEVPYGVLTGDTLFIGDVGRPDLLASIGVTADELGRMLYHSVHETLMGLPDAVRVFPAHGAGSACGKNLSTERQSTIGEQRATNYACAPMSEEEFVGVVTAGQPSAPSYFVYDAILNRKERGLYDPANAPRAFSAAEVLERRDAGAVIVDARSDQEYGNGHLRGSINVQAEGRFAEWTGMVVSPEEEVIVIAPEGQEVELVTRLARIGFDRVSGYLQDPEGAFVALADEMERSSRLTADELSRAMADDTAPVVLDVRGGGEREEGHIEGSLHIPLAELRRRMEEVPQDRPVVVHCAGGMRSSIGASLLLNQGRTDISDLLGGYGAWLSLSETARA